MFKTNILLCFASLFAFAYATRQRASPPLAITNGVEVIPHSYPYQARIIINDGDWIGKSTCGGILISPKYVLTAAQCVKGHRKIEVVLGAHNVTKKESTQQRLKAIDCVAHPNYNESTYSNDIALIELQKKVYVNDAIVCAKLPKKNNGISLRGRYATIIGWGVTTNDYGNHGTSAALMETISTIVNNTQCNKGSNKSSDKELCLSGTYGRGACVGDVGGPVIIDGVVYGIISHGSPNCQSNTPTIATKITPYLKWIQDNSDCDIEDYDDDNHDHAHDGDDDDDDHDHDHDHDDDDDDHDHDHDDDDDDDDHDHDDNGKGGECR